MKIVNKFKFIRSTSILIFLLIAIFNISIAKETETEAKTITYTVSQGDTLWNIAEQYKEDNQDTREYIHEIKKLNNMTNSNIYAGQTIKIWQ